jgi:methylmalonyl-CoA/ethylmalonyl-CoA epimerase
MIRKLHHIGIASRNIQADMSFYGLLGYAAKGALREDVDAGIKVQFMSADGQPDLELVQNLVKDGPMTPHLQAKRKVFHFAYETDDLKADAQRLIDEQGAMWLVPITEADCAEISAWCYLAFRNMMILELVQVRR